MVVEVIRLAREVITTKRKNAILSEQNKDKEAKPIKARAVKSTMREQIEGGKRCITTLKFLSGKAQYALKKIVGESFRMEANHRVQMVVTEEALNC